MPNGSAPFDVITFDRIIAERNEKNQHTASLFAIVAWIGSSIWWISTTPEAHFFSWQTVVLLIPGMFAASLILGGGSYLAMMGLQALILKLPSAYQSLPAALGGFLMPIVEIFIAYRVAGLALAFLLSIGTPNVARSGVVKIDAPHAVVIPLTAEKLAQFEELYLARLDAWVSGGGKPEDAQSSVVETCGRLIMVTASAAEAVAFMKERREDLDLRVDVCAKLTITRAHPQPEFSKPEIRKIVCEDMPKEQAVFETLCKRAGLR